MVGEPDRSATGTSGSGARADHGGAIPSAPAPDLPQGFRGPRGAASATTTGAPAAAGEEAPPRSFDIALVCTGNQFRTPLAEALIRQRCGHVGVAVRSYGVTRAGSSGILPITEEAARSYGLDLSQHRATKLGPDDLRDADLVVGFEESHLFAARQIGGAPPERTFTLIELVRLLWWVDVDRDLEPPARLRAAVRDADALRKGEAGIVTGITELPAPVGGPPSAYLDAAARLVASVDEMCARLLG